MGLLASVAMFQARGAIAETPDAPPIADTPRPTATPTPSPADLTLASGFTQLGKFDAAVGAYSAVIERGSPGERLTARISLAELLLDDGQDSAAVQQLEAYLIEAPLSADVRAAQLLLAEALKGEGHYADAVSLYDAYLQQNGPAAAYAQMGRAEALAWLGDASASSAGESVLESALPKSTRLGFITTMARALESALPQDALAWYERLGSESSDPADDATALWQSAVIQRDLGDNGPWFAVWPRIIKQYPDTPAAVQAVDDAPPYKIIGEIIDPYYTGVVYYDAGDSKVARADFLASLSLNRSGDPTLAGRASFYLAVLDERSSNFGSAIARYGDVLDFDSKVDLADDALWWQGRLYERQRQPEQARAAYQRILSDYSRSSFAKDARFRIALLQYDAEKWDEAAAAFAAIAQSSRGSEKQRALLWQGKALAAAGDKKGANTLWQSLATSAPDDYYGLRAAVLLGKGQGKLRDATIGSTEAPDWEAIEAWLLDSGGGDPAAAQQTFAANEHWAAGQSLLALGMEHRAGAEFDALLQSSLGDPNMLYLLSKEFYSIGQFGLSARAAARLLTHVPKQALATAPEDLWTLAYPAPYAEAVRDAAKESKVPNVLLLALVRQESFFDPLAGSSAGAIGLTQVVGPTGEEIANELGVSDFETDDLFRPDVSLQFGAHYLRTQLDTFDGNFYEALAAYNAGPGNVQRWAKTADGDVDRFTAEVEFSQTQSYVQLVSENVARYRQLYQGLDEPALPKD
jgi:soluble lytic murein transglycosylase